MQENHCCGGGHCGPLPGYDFICPLCKKDAYAPTGDPLQTHAFFTCSQCASRFQVKGIRDNVFDVIVVDHV